jgi:hypothetical protein
MQNKYGPNANNMMAKINEEADKYQAMGIFERMAMGGNNKKTRRRTSRRRKSTKRIRKTKLKRYSKTRIKQKNRKSKKRI